jgi:hypothetical protein
LANGMPLTCVSSSLLVDLASNLSHRSGQFLSWVPIYTDLTLDRIGLQEPCQPVQDKRACHGHVETGPGADHRDLDGDVDQFYCVIGNPVVVVPQQDGSPLPRGSQVCQSDRLIGKLDAG